MLQAIFRILEHNLLCSIATVTAQNRAHNNTAYFCYSGELELYFLSHPDSLHSRNLRANPSMAITIFSSRQNWTDPGDEFLPEKVKILDEKQFGDAVFICAEVNRTAPRS